MKPCSTSVPTFSDSPFVSHEKRQISMLIVNLVSTDVGIAKLTMLTGFRLHSTGYMLTGYIRLCTFLYRDTSFGTYRVQRSRVAHHQPSVLVAAGQARREEGREWRKAPTRAVTGAASAQPAPSSRPQLPHLPQTRREYQQATGTYCATKELSKLS